MHKLQSTHQKQNQKQIMRESNKSHVSNWKKKQKKNTKSVKKNENNFINIIRGKFAMSIR